MSNPYRGETDLRLGDRTYPLRLTINMLAHLETTLDATGFGLLQKLLGGGATVIRAVFHACLTVQPARQLPAHLPELSLMDLGDLMEEQGGLKALKETYWLLMVNAEVIDRDDAEKGGLIPKGKSGPKDGAGAETATESAVPQMRLASGSAGS